MSVKVKNHLSYMLETSPRVAYYTKNHLPAVKASFKQTISALIKLIVQFVGVIDIDSLTVMQYLLPIDMNIHNSRELTMLGRKHQIIFNHIFRLKSTRRGKSNKNRFQVTFQCRHSAKFHARLRFSGLENIQIKLSRLE